LDLPEDTAPSVSSLDDAALAVSTLEGELIAAETKPQFDALFRRAQDLTKQIEGDERLGPLEQAAVDQHLRELLIRARIAYDRNRDAARSVLAESTERLELSEESLSDAETIAQVQEVRSDLRLTRETLRAVNAWAPRDAQARVWEQWQRANQTAWTKLNECWSRNEGELHAILDQAEADMDRGNPRSAKARIKQFHERARNAEGSHASMKKLRSRARQLWERATAASKEQHEAYVVIARKRLDYLRTLADRAAQNRRKVESEVSVLEAKLQQAQTDVAAALLRGQLEERRKQLRRLDAESAGLVRRIGETEEAVT
jgi:hypothetical protein